MNRLRGKRRLQRTAVVVAGVATAIAAGTGGTLAVLSADGSAPTPTPTVAAPVARTVPAPAVPATARAPKPDSRSTVVAAPRGVAIFDAPGGHPRLTLPGRTQLGATQTLLTAGARAVGTRTVGTQGDWWQVLLPVRPNGATGWVRKADVQASTITTRIEINLGAHRLTFVRDGAVVARYPVAVGTRRTPTPVGRFFVNENPATGNPSGAYGPYALGLSGHSDVLQQFGSGDGVLGIHGTNEPSSIGTDASHGCVRLRNADITALYRATPLGTPVVVT
jgi:lipoprotein-anchoring transpeptidase ErfK/SrfK